MKATQRSFTAGEVSPSVGARADLEWYSSALSKCKNAYVRAQGGVYNREGTKFIGDGGVSTNGQARLISFSYNKEESYIILVNHLNIQIIFKDNFVMMPGSTTQRLTVTTPFAKPWDISHSSFADTITMVDGAVPPQVLKRYAHNDWRMEAIQFDNTVPRTKTITLTHGGTGKSGDDTRTYDYAVSCVDENGGESLRTAREIVSFYLSSTSYITIEIEAIEVIKSFNIYKALSGSSQVYGFIGRCDKTAVAASGELVGRFEDFNYAPDMTITPPTDNNPFKESDEKPRACGFHQQRRIFASTEKDPQKIFCSQTGDINSMRFSKPLRATDAIIQEVVSDTVNDFRHVVSLGGLILLTAEGELQVTSGQDEVLTPHTFGVKTISSYGASLVVPAKAENTVIFSQDNGARLIGINASSLGSSDFGAGFSDTNLSIRADHLFKGRKIVDMTYCKEPYQIVWCVLDNGVLIGLTYDKEHKVWGFHQHETQGQFTSATTIHQDGISATYFIVTRTIKNPHGDDRQVRYVEKLAARRDDIDKIEDCYFVDCGKSYSGNPTDSFTGLDHLEGLLVSILADGMVISGTRVSGGAVRLSLNAKKVHVGLAYETEINTLPLDSASRSTRGERKGVTRVHVDVLNSDSFSVEPIRDTNILETPPVAQAGDVVQGVISTGSEELRVAGDITDYGQLSFKHSKPLPLCILSITSEFEEHS